MHPKPTSSAFVYCSPSSLLNLCSVGKPSMKRITSTTVHEKDDLDHQQWHFHRWENCPLTRDLYNSLQRQCFLGKPHEAPLRWENLLLHFFSQNPLTPLICWKIMWPFISIIAASPAQFIRNNSQIPSMWKSRCTASTEKRFASAQSVTRPPVTPMNCSSICSSIQTTDILCSPCGKQFNQKRHTVETHAKDA